MEKMKKGFVLLKAEENFNLKAIRDINSFNGFIYTFMIFLDMLLSTSYMAGYHVFESIVTTF